MEEQTQSVDIKAINEKIEKESAFAVHPILLPDVTRRTIL